MCSFIFKLKLTNVQYFLGAGGAARSGGDNNISYHLLSAYYVPNTLLRTLRVHPVLTLTPPSQLRPCCLRCLRRGESRPLAHGGGVASER